MAFSLTQSLPPELRARLEEKAARQGEEPDTLLIDVIARFVAGEPSVSLQAAESRVVVSPTPDGEAEAERFRRWADGRPPRTAPVIPLDALDREHIYEGLN